DRKHSAAQIDAEFRLTVESILDTHPDKGKPQHGCLMWGRGQTYDGLATQSPKAAALGRYTQCFESGGIGVPLLHARGYSDIADEYAEWLGPHPWAIRLLDTPPGRPPGPEYRYGAGVVHGKPGEIHHGYYDPYEVDDDRQRTPYIRWAMWNDEPPSDAAIEAHWTLEDGPADYSACRLLK